MRTIEVVFYRDGEAWVAQALNVDVSSFGDTREESRSAIKEALELYFEDASQAEIIHVADVEFESVTVGTLYQPPSRAGIGAPGPRAGPAEIGRER